jgi:FkbM family methyltransferase
MGILRLIRGAVRFAGFDIVPYSPRRERSDQFSAHDKLGIDPHVIVDVGANKGITVDSYLEEYADARVIAVEPLPHLAQELSHRYSTRENVLVVNAAIDETCGTRVLHNTVVDGNSSFFEVSAQQRSCLGHDDKTRVKENLEVPTTTLDRLAADCRLDRIDILKLDVQGAELLALKGAEALLSERRIRAIYCEVLFAPIYEGQCQFHEIAELVERHGYWLYDLFGPNHQLDGSITHSNALFLSPEVQRGRWE